MMTKTTSDLKFLYPFRGVFSVKIIKIFKTMNFSVGITWRIFKSTNAWSHPR